MAVVYSITSDKGDKVYVGSTINFERRIRDHKDIKHNRCTSEILVNEYGYENLKFNILEHTTAEDRYIRERHHLDNTLNTVNKMRPVVSLEEKKELVRFANIKYQTEHAEEYKAYNKEWFQNNRDKTREYDKIRSDTEERQLWKKQWREANKERINQLQREAYAKRKNKSL